MSLTRFTDPGPARAVDRATQDLATAFDRWGDPLEVFFPAAGAAAAIEHGLGAIPDGVLVILTVGGHVRATQYPAWSRTTAYLVADAANVRARVVFVTCRKELRNG